MALDAAAEGVEAGRGAGREDELAVAVHEPAA
jgi:hypothetical protein